MKSGQNINKRSRVLVIGNGFDLDLKFDTTYTHFFKSFFKGKLLFADSTLNQFLKKQFEERPDQNWYDLEAEIRKYALKCQLKEINPTIDMDRQFMAFLRYSLNMTLNIFAHVTITEETNPYVERNISEYPELFINPYQFQLSRDCLAYQTCEELVRNPDCFDKIISFNYTMFRNYIKNIASESAGYDPDAIKLKMKELDLDNRFLPIHISHKDCLLPEDYKGPCSGFKGYSLGICGVDDDIAVPRKMNFLKKSEQFDDTHTKDLALEYINHADDLVIFGHSLGICDYDYFKSYFRNLFSYNSEGKSVEIITLNEKAGAGILENIATMVGNTTEDIVADKNFQKINFVYTKKNK